METLLAVIQAAAGMFVVLALCFAWMWWVRRRSNDRKDQDVLEHMAHGCAGCKGDGACQNRKAEEEHHELA